MFASLIVSLIDYSIRGFVDYLLPCLVLENIFKLSGHFAGSSAKRRGTIELRMPPRTAAKVARRTEQRLEGR